MQVSKAANGEASAARERVRGPNERPPGPALRKKGVLSRIAFGANFLLNPLGFVGSRFAQYGDIYYVPEREGAGLYVLRHPDHIRDVLITQASKFDKKHSGVEQLRQILGDGLLTTDGDVWRRQRRLVQPAFTRARLADYAEVMIDEAERDTERYRHDETFDVATEMMELTLRVVSRTLLGYSAGSGEAEDVRAAMTDMQSSIVSLGNVGPKWLRPSYHRTRRATALLDRIIYGLIEKRRQDGPSDGPVDLLQMLLEARDEEGDGGGLSDREIRDQLLTLYVAGHETTSNALTWTLYLLSQAPEVEARLHQELEEVLGGRPPTFEDFERLTYTDQIITEAMRIYPPVPIIARKAHSEAQIGGWRIPAGSEVVMWIYHTHHDARWYPEPWEFRPERWEKSEVAKRPKQSYLPFSSGARACIGKMFAQIEAVLVLATLAQKVRFDLEPDHPVEMQPRVTLNPKYGMRMIARRRG
jgi:cytochrome P450